MSFMRQVSHALDEEHRSNLDLLGRVEQVLARMRPGELTYASNGAKVD